MAEQVAQTGGILTIRKMVVMLCGLAFFYGIHRTSNRNPDFATLLLVWAMDVLTIFICARDAQNRGRVLLHSYRWIMFFTWPLSIWVYYGWCRGLKGLGIALLWTLILTAVYVAGGVVVMLVAG